MLHGTRRLGYGLSDTLADASYPVNVIAPAASRPTNAHQYGSLGLDVISCKEESDGRFGGQRGTAPDDRYAGVTSR